MIGPVTTSTATLAALLVVMCAAHESANLLCCEGLAAKLDHMRTSRKADHDVMRQELQQVADNVFAVGGKVETMRNDFLHDLERLKMDILHALGKRVGPLAPQQQPTTSQQSVNGTMSSKEISIRTLVEDFNRSNDWPTLWLSLYSMLDNRSMAFAQLHNISSGEIMPLWQIGFNGFTELAVVLLDAGLDPDKRDAEGFVLLHGAAIGGRVSMSTVLLGRGANLEARDRWGKTPLLQAASDSQLEMSRWLVARGADVDASGSDGWTSLHYAAYRDDLELARFLLEAGASAEATENSGATPLDFARTGKLTAMTEFLLQYAHEL